MLNERQMLNDSDWNNIQNSIPIVCVDVLPIRFSAERQLESIGLIWRDEVPSKQGWCTVGGRLLYDESLYDAICRQLRQTLGSDIHYKLEDFMQPTYVAQYAPTTKLVSRFDAIDPRKHAIGLTYCLEIKGTVHPRDEAKDFKWFPLEVIPWNSFGFHQEVVIKRCLERIK